VSTLSELERRSVELLEQLCREFPMTVPPKLVWKALRVSAGIAKYHPPTIVLSKSILTDMERMESTLRHEYAHLLAVARHGRKAAGHGRWWQEAMRDLGCEPKVRHSYPVERNQARQEVAYRCKRCGEVLKRNRRLARGRRYYHVPCGGALTLEYVQAL